MYTVHYKFQGLAAMVQGAMLRTFVAIVRSEVVE